MHTNKKIIIISIVAVIIIVLIYYLTRKDYFCNSSQNGKLFKNLPIQVCVDGVINSAGTQDLYCPVIATAQTVPCASYNCCGNNPQQGGPYITGWFCSGPSYFICPGKPAC